MKFRLLEHLFVEILYFSKLFSSREKLVIRIHNHAIFSSKASIPRSTSCARWTECYSIRRIFNGKRPNHICAQSKTIHYQVCRLNPIKESHESNISSLRYDSREEAVIMGGWPGEFRSKKRLGFHNRTVRPVFVIVLG